MKKYFFDTPVTQWEKSAEHDCLFCAPARCFVLAENETEAAALAEEKLRAEYHGTGRLLLGELKLTKTAELPVDWSYGYGDKRKTGATNRKTVAKLVDATVIK